MEQFDTSALSGTQYTNRQFTRSQVVVSQEPDVVTVTAALQSPSRVIGSHVFESVTPAFVVNLEGGDGALRVTPSATAVPSLVIGDWKISMGTDGNLHFSRKQGVGPYVDKMVVGADA